MKTLKSSLVAIVTALLLPVFAAAAPLLINYQGRLVDSAGNPLTGSPSIRFSIHDAASAGSELWFETQSVTPDNGIFSVSLGSVTPLPASVFASDSRYLEVKIGADSPLAPRTRLLSTPYALYTANLGSSGQAALISTDTVMSGSQLQLGNFATLPGGMGEGAIVYDSGTKQINFWNGTAWTALAAGGVSPWSISANKVILVDGENSVGVGTGSPAYKLHVSSAAGEAGDILVVSTGASNIFRVSGAGEVRANKYYGDGSALTGIVTSDKVLKAGDTMTGTLVMDAATAFTTSDQASIFIATHVSVNGQLKVGAYASAPDAAALGAGALYYNNAGVLYVSNGASWSPLASGGASPWTGGGTGTVSLVAVNDKVTMTNTSADSLKVSGGITAGSGNVAIVDTTGKIPALSGAYFSSVDGSALTGLTGAQVDLSTVAAAISGGLAPLQAAVSTAVYTVNSYPNPSWITSLATGKIDLSTVTAAISGGLAPVNAALSTGVYTTQAYADPSWITSLATSKIDLSTVAAIVQPIEAAISTAVYSVNSYANPSWITSLATAKIDLSTVTAALSNASNLTSGTLADGRLSGTYSAALTFGSAAGGPITFSTNVVLSASQLKLGVFTGNPATNAGMGALYYDQGDGLLHYSNGAAWTALAAGGASPWSGGGTGTVSLVAPTDKVSMTSTASDALDVAGGITAGSGNVAIVDTTGKIPALSGTYFASLSGANLTALPSSQLSGGVPTALVNLTTVTSALAGKLDTGTGIPVALVNLSTVTAAISPIQAAISTGVYTVGSYANPAWITSLAASKLTGAIAASAVDLSTVTAAISPIQAAISTGVYTVGSYANPAWITSLATSKISLSTVTAAIAPIQAAISTGVYTTNTYPNPAWLTSLATSKIDLSTVTAAI
ncbi:MAG: hypothetical protein NDI60_06480, partial [Elusimicrobiales bacterium]|nr:hypothetical protein [Elusimicrobiales bacterium]